MLRARIVSAIRDTAGEFILDTGAGYLALDEGLGVGLGLERAEARGSQSGVALSSGPIERMEMAGHAVRGLQPVLLFDASAVRQAVDRPILGLVGRQALGNGCIVIDYSSERLIFQPALPGASGADHVVPFELLGDAKIVVRASIGGGRAGDFILDTGATKCVLFEEQLGRVAPGHRSWRGLEGLSAPTVSGEAAMRLVRLPTLRVGRRGPVVAGVEAGVISGTLGRQLAQVTGRPIVGLIGYSYLERFRLAIDYGGDRLVFTPVPDYQDPRPYEFTTVGLQLARSPRGAEVSAVATGSPAAQAGIAAGDAVLQVDTLAAGRHGVLALMRALEGAAGTTVTLRLARGDSTRTVQLRRRVLL